MNSPELACVEDSRTPIAVVVAGPSIGAAMPVVVAELVGQDTDLLQAIQGTAVAEKRILEDQMSLAVTLAYRGGYR